MKLELANKERQVLLRLLEEALQSPRWPLSPDVEALRRIADRPQGDEKSKPSGH
jgi:hypothetical protein